MKAKALATICIKFFKLKIKSNGVFYNEIFFIFIFCITNAYSTMILDHPKDPSLFIEKNITQMKFAHYLRKARTQN